MPAVRRHLPGGPAGRSLAVWLVILACGAGLLYGRYDWNTGGGFFARRGFWLSLYLFLIMLPTVFYLARRTLHSERVAIGLTAIVFVVFTLPYKLLGLTSLFYYHAHAQGFQIASFPYQTGPGFVVSHLPEPKLQFLPGGSLSSFPLDYVFMPLLFVLGAACIWGVWRIRARAGFRAARSVPRLLTIAFLLICVQTFVHAGMRAPYTYLSYFQEPQAQKHWYVVYHFADQSGATEGDQYVFAPLEDYFEGAPYRGNNALIRRPFAFYLESQISYFINDYYGWLALNCLFWLAAVFATARLVGRLATPRAGLIAGALVLFGSGFIAFVGTTAMYMQNYAAAAIALCAFEDLVVNPPDRGPRRYALFAGILALCALTYDLEPLFLVMLAYGLSRRVPWRPLLGCLAGAFALLEGFTYAVTDVVHIGINPENSVQLSTGLRATWHLITHPTLPTWYDTVVTVVPSYLHLWLQSFFVIPPILAILGLRRLRDRSLYVLVGSLFLMGLAIIAVLQIGNQLIGTVPRLIYPTFIGVYLPAAVALDGFAERAHQIATGRNGLRRLRAATPWIVVAVMALLANIDVFGYPTLYVEFFVSTPPSFLPG